MDAQRKKNKNVPTDPWPGKGGAGTQRYLSNRQSDSVGRPAPNLGGLAGKNEDKLLLEAGPEESHLSFIIYHNAVGLEPQLRNARLYRYHFY